MRAAATALLVSVMSTTGCYATSVRSGLPPAREAVFERWHHVYLLGLIEGSGPYDLQRLCPEGWAEINTSTDPWQSTLVVLTLAIYLPQTITIVCASPQSPKTAPKNGFTPDQYPSSLPEAQAIPPVTDDPISNAKQKEP